MQLVIFDMKSNVVSPSVPLLNSPLKDDFLVRSEKCKCKKLWNYGAVVRSFGLYWGGIRFESLSTRHCWSLSKSFIPSLMVWSMTKNDAFGGKKQNEKSNGEQSDLCDLEQVTLKPQLQAHHWAANMLP